MRTVKWGEYRIGDIFEKLPAKKAEKSEVRNKRDSEFCIPVVYCKYGDNGIMYWGRKNKFTTYKNVISIVYNGVIAAGKVYAQKEETGILAESYFVSLKHYKPSFYVNLFLASVLEKKLYYRYSRDYLATWEGKVENDYIYLPIANGAIDFNFMNDFIAELESERKQKLSTYLSVNGFKDCETSNCNILKSYNYNIVQWKEFKMGDLFEKISTKKLSYQAKDLPSEAKDDFVLPCLTSSFNNQGLNYYVPYKGATVLKNVITIPSNSDVYRAYFQSSDFTVLSDAYAIDWKYDERKLTREQYLFMVMCINMVTDRPIYSHKNKLGGWNVVKNKYIMLPVANGKIDFAFMHNLISAIEKLVIKDVVIYCSDNI